MLPLILCCLFAAQDVAPAQSARFKARSDLVVLHVSVVDRKEGFVPGLAADAFIVYENGRPQKIEFFQNDYMPVTVGLVLDSSISMLRRRAAVIAAGRTFVESSHPDDEMFTMNFNEKVWPGLPHPQLFTTDRDEILRALEQAGARGRTALFDALKASLERLSFSDRRKKVLIVVSDGGDNASTTRFEEVLQMAQQMDAVIFTVTVYDQYNTEGNPHVLKKLAKATGGEAFFLRDVDEVANVLARVARDIRNSYTIGYTPGGGPAGFRSIRVNVRRPDGRKIVVRARSGYLAGGAQ